MVDSFIKNLKASVGIAVFIVSSYTAYSQEMTVYKHHMISLNSVFGRYSENTMTKQNLIENNSLRGINIAYTYRIEPRVGFHFNYSRLTCPDITNSRSRHSVVGIKLTTKANKRLQFFMLPVIGIGKYQTWDESYASGVQKFKLIDDYRNIDVGISLGFDIHIAKFMFLSFQANTRTSAQRFNGYSNASFGFGVKL